MPVVLEIEGHAERFETPEDAALHLLDLSDRGARQDDRARRNERLVILGRLLRDRAYWRRALNVYQDAIDRGYADPVRHVQQWGFPGFNSEQDARNVTAELDRKIARLRAALRDHLALRGEVLPQ